MGMGGCCCLNSSRWSPDPRLDTLWTRHGSAGPSQADWVLRCRVSEVALLTFREQTGIDDPNPRIGWMNARFCGARGDEQQQLWVGVCPPDSPSRRPSAVIRIDEAGQQTKNVDGPCQFLSLTTDRLQCSHPRAFRATRLVGGEVSSRDGVVRAAIALVRRRSEVGICHGRPVPPAPACPRLDRQDPRTSRWRASRTAHLREIQINSRRKSLFCADRGK